MTSNCITLDLNNLSDKNIDEYSKIVRQIRTDFNKLIEDLSSNNAKTYWLLSSIVSREPEFSPLFKRCCYLELIKLNLSTRSDLTKIIIYDRQLYIFVKKYTQSSYSNLTLQYINESKTPFESFYLFIRKYIRTFSFIFFSIFVKLFSKNKFYKSSSSLILITTHILNREHIKFEKKEYIDRYYPDIFNYLNKSIQDKMVFVPGFPGGPKNHLKLIKKLKQSDINFLLKEDFLKISDYFFSLTCSLKLLLCKPKKTIFRGVEITSLVKSELMSFSFDYKLIESVLNYRFVYRLNKNKIDISMFIDWYENHMSSKGFMLGFNMFMPHVDTIGYQGIIDSAIKKINLHPTIFERKSGLLPKFFYVIGKKLVRDFKEFDDSINVLVGPSFRYNYLWSEKKINNNQKEFTILVALPIFQIEAKSILNLIFESLQILPRNLPIKIRVKFHPTHNQSKIDETSLIDDNRVEYINGSFVDYIYETSLLITGASTTCIEAMTLGVPVVISGTKDGIANTSIPESIPNHFYKTISNDQELVEYIISLLGQNNDNGVLSREDYFQEVSYESVAKFFSPNRYS